MLAVGTAVSVACFAIALVLEFLGRPEGAGSATDLGAVLRSAVALETWGWATLGTFAVIASPVAAIVATALEYRAAGDRRTALTAVGVLAILGRQPRGVAARAARAAGRAPVAEPCGRRSVVRCLDGSSPGGSGMRPRHGIARGAGRFLAGLVTAAMLLAPGAAARAGAAEPIVGAWQATIDLRGERGPRVDPVHGRRRRRGDVT